MRNFLKRGGAIMFVCPICRKFYKQGNWINVSKEKEQEMILASCNMQTKYCDEHHGKDEHELNLGLA